MSRRSLALALVAAFLVPTLLLGWIGLGSLREESQRGEARYRAQAEAIAQSVASELGKLLEGLKSGQEELHPLALYFAADGTWLGETLEVRHTPGVGDQALLMAIASELDRLQAQGNWEGALARLAQVEEKSADLELIAWALDARVAILDQLGRAEEASAARRDLIARYPLSRSSRGLLRSFAARLALADTEPDPLQTKLDLYADVASDYSALDQTATAEFLRQLREQLGAAIAASDVHFPALDSVDRADAARARLRVWLASLRMGAADWVARGAPGGCETTATSVAPIASSNPRSMESAFDRGRAGAGEFVIALARSGDEWKGAAAELGPVFEHALDIARADTAARSLGFMTAIDKKQTQVAGVIARVELGLPLREYVVNVRGGDLPAFLAGERKRFALIAGLVVLTILTAAVAAWLSLRAIAREVDAARGREAFVAAVTHELKTPLAAIRLFAEMLEHGDVEPAKVREFGARTVVESDRLARLVDSVLDFARIEHAGTLLGKARVDLASVAASATSIIEGVARERGFEIVLISSSTDAFVSGDRDALTRALVNLLDNAIKYSEYAHKIEVEVSRRSDGFAEVAVLDRGRGVPEAERTRIFESFRRVGSELTRDRPGVGLGLALVAKTAAAHGGRALCEARDGGGSRFALLLPLAPEDVA